MCRHTRSDMPSLLSVSSDPLTQTTLIPRPAQLHHRISLSEAQQSPRLSLCTSLGCGRPCGVNVENFVWLSRPLAVRGLPLAAAKSPLKDVGSAHSPPFSLVTLTKLSLSFYLITLGIFSITSLTSSFDLQNRNRNVRR